MTPGRGRAGRSSTAPAGYSVGRPQHDDLGAGVGMPLTVSRNSPPTNVLPSNSRPSPTKNAVTVSRSATVMPTWSKRRACDMGSSSNYSSCRSTPRTSPTGRSRHRSRGFRTRRTLVDPRRAVPTPLNLPARVSRPRGVLQLAPRYRRSEPPSRRVPADRHAACWLAGSPDPSQSPASTELTRSARTCGCLAVGAARKRQCRKRLGVRTLGSARCGSG